MGYPFWRVIDLCGASIFRNVLFVNDTPFCVDTASVPPLPRKEDLTEGVGLEAERLADGQLEEAEAREDSLQASPYLS